MPSKNVCVLPRKEKKKHLNHFKENEGFNQTFFFISRTSRNYTITLFLKVKHLGTIGTQKSTIIRRNIVKPFLTVSSFGVSEHKTLMKGARFMHSSVSKKKSNLCQSQP